MKTFAVKLRSGEQFHVYGNHLYYSDGMLQVVVWDQERQENRCVALFLLLDVQRAYALEALTPEQPPTDRPVKGIDLCQNGIIAIIAITALLSALAQFLR